jgi:membrane-bound metal-dependent hydrolase YbcI (DUF457 family)
VLILWKSNFYSAPVPSFKTSYTPTPISYTRKFVIDVSYHIYLAWLLHLYRQAVWNFRRLGIGAFIDLDLHLVVDVGGIAEYSVRCRNEGGHKGFGLAQYAASEEALQLPAEVRLLSGLPQQIINHYVPSILHSQSRFIINKASQLLAVSLVC